MDKAEKISEPKCMENYSFKMYGTKIHKKLFEMFGTKMYAKLFSQNVRNQNVLKIIQLKQKIIKYVTQDEGG